MPILSRQPLPAKQCMARPRDFGEARLQLSPGVDSLHPQLCTIAKLWTAQRARDKTPHEETREVTGTARGMGT